MAVWVVSALLPKLRIMWVGGLFFHQLSVMTTLGGVVEIVVGAIAGASLYQESPASPGRLLL